MLALSKTYCTGCSYHVNYRCISPLSLKHKLRAVKEFWQAPDTVPSISDYLTRILVANRCSIVWLRTNTVGGRLRIRRRVHGIPMFISLAKAS